LKEGDWIEGLFHIDPSFLRIIFFEGDLYGLGALKEMRRAEEEQGTVNLTFLRQA